MDDAKTPPKPRDARTMEAILKAMGVESYDPRVVNQLLELEYRYITQVLREAHSFSEHAEKQSIDMDDVRLAIRSKCAFTFTQPPPRETTMLLAAERNSIPLPPIEQRAGVALPPAKNQLTAQSYQVVVTPKKRGPRSAQYASPKRPRLVSSPVKPLTSAPARTPDKSPGSSRIVGPRSAPSPKPMNVDSPAKQATPNGKKSPAPRLLPPAATPGLPPIHQKSPIKSSASPRTGAAGSAPSQAGVGKPAAPPSSDVVVIDDEPEKSATVGVLDTIKTPDAAQVSVSGTPAAPKTATVSKPS